MTKTLLERQFRFTDDVNYLIGYAYNMGYTLTFGEAYRTPEQAALNAKLGIGIKNSLHCQRLAVDFHAFKPNDKGEMVLLTKSEDYKELGEYWKSLNKDNRWGGDFTKPDGNHFSQTYNGVS
jgi:hypothetical protein